MQAVDPLTKENFIKRRNNQKFANRRNQIRFNNIKAQQKRNATAFVTRILDRNRTILKKTLGDKKEIVVSRDYLLGAGFSFNYYSFQVPVNEVTFAGIYEFGISKTTGDQYKIIKFND